MPNLYIRGGKKPGHVKGAEIARTIGLPEPKGRFRIVMIDERTGQRITKGTYGGEEVAKKKADLQKVFGRNYSFEVEPL